MPRSLPGAPSSAQPAPRSLPRPPVLRQPRARTCLVAPPGCPRRLPEWRGRRPAAGELAGNGGQRPRVRGKPGAESPTWAGEGPAGGSRTEISERPDPGRKIASECKSRVSPCRPERGETLEVDPGGTRRGQRWHPAVSFAGGPRRRRGAAAPVRSAQSPKSSPAPSLRKKSAASSTVAEGARAWVSGARLRAEAAGSEQSLPAGRGGGGKPPRGVRRRQLLRLPRRMPGSAIRTF